MGSLPLPWDVETLVKEHGVGAVINMTREYSGKAGEAKPLSNSGASLC